MKRIAIFCDGTWNWTGASRTTHVVRLAQAVRPTAQDADRTTQIVHYLPGVGTGRGTGKIARAIDKSLGGAFGWGLDGNVREAYRNLVFAYEPGDRIFIFGFSRGAYTARSLAGLIRKAGLLPIDQVHQVGEAIEMYRWRGEANHPEAPHVRGKRAELSPRYATSQDDLEWRQAQGDTTSELLCIDYLGVWDTVGALGMPRVLGPVTRWFNKKYDFHDHVLSRSVSHARHAVAIDERRRLFPPTLWDNIDVLNDGETTPDSAYQQLWFPGNHSIVGGSGSVPELSAFPTGWIAEGASDLGLEFDRTRLDAITGVGNAAADDGGAAQQPAADNLFGKLLADRDLRVTLDPETGIPIGDHDPAVVSPAAWDRARMTDYAPKTLQPVLG